MAWEPDRRSNFFFNPPARLFAVTYMTEISLIVTLSNQFHFTKFIVIPFAFDIAFKMHIKEKSQQWKN